MASFIRSNNDWFIYDTPKGNVCDELPVANYTVQFSEKSGYYLTQTEPFAIPERTYGSEIRRSGRVISTFLDRNTSTGIVLSGDKGSGKSLLAKKLSIELANEHGISTIVVNSKLQKDHVGAFINFIQSIAQPVMVLLDEFEKVFDSDTQKALLTLFDGTSSTKKLYVVTVNDLYKVDEFMINRPGRFYYMFRYGGVPEDAIREYCEEQLVMKDQTNTLVNYSKMFRAFTFDMLTSVVEEMNRYNEPLEEVLKYMNVSHNDQGGSEFEITEIIMSNGTKLEKFGDVDYGGKSDPLSKAITISFPQPGSDDDEDEDQWKYSRLNVSDIISIEKDGSFVYKNKEFARIVIKPKKKKTALDGLHHMLLV